MTQDILPVPGAPPDPPPFIVTYEKSGLFPWVVKREGSADCLGLYSSLTAAQNRAHVLAQAEKVPAYFRRYGWITGRRIDEVIYMPGPFGIPDAPWVRTYRRELAIIGTALAASGLVVLAVEWWSG